MKQATLYGVGDLRMEERALDTANLDADQLYVETEVTALSTGQISETTWAIPPTYRMHQTIPDRWGTRTWEPSSGLAR